MDRPGVTFQLAAQEVGGVLEDPNEDIAFLVGVTKTGITNEDLTDNSTTMTVSKAWYDQKLAEGKDIFITKIDEEGNFFTQAATCVVTGATVTCTVKFSDDAGGFSEFVLISVVRPETPTTAQPTPTVAAATPEPTATPVPPTATPTPTVAPQQAAAPTATPIVEEPSDGLGGGIIAGIIGAVLGGIVAAIAGYLVGTRRRTATPA